MKKTLKVFIIDKDQTSSAIIQSYLNEIGYEMTVEKADSLSAVENSIDENALNIFIIDVSENENALIREINDIEDKHQNCKFIITSYGLKTDYIVRFLRKSKKDFLEKPILKTKFLDILNEIIEKLTSEQDYSGHGKILSIFSNKGGLGKTTVAVNLAYELGQLNKLDKVAIVDMNMFLGDVTTFLDVNPPYDMKFIVDKIGDSTEIVDITAQYSDSNLYVIADSPYREYANNIPQEGIIKLFNALRKKFKYIVVDCSSAITGKTKNVLDLSDLIMLISEANLPTLRNCKRCLDFLERIGDSHKTELLLNRYSYDDCCQIQDIESVLKKDIFAKIPNDWQIVTESINRGITIGECYLDSDINDAFVELSDLVMKRLCR